MKSSKHIVFVTPLYLPCHLLGSAMVVRDLAEVLSDSGKKITIITSNALTARYWYDPFFGKKLERPSETLHGVLVLRLRCNQIASALLFILNIILRKAAILKKIFRGCADCIEILSWGPILQHLNDTIVDSHPDLVVLSPFPAGLCLTAKDICLRHGIRYCVIPFFKKEQKLFENKLLKNILDHAFSIFTPTNAEKKYIQHYTANKKIYLLPSSIDVKFIDIHKREIYNEMERLRRVNNFVNKKIVLFVGNKGRGKGVIDAAEAVKALHKQNIVFVAMGNNTIEWNRYVSNERDNTRMIDVPYLTDVAKYAYYALCEVLILPSTTDNFPLVFLEAWQFKKPVLAYDFYSMKELVVDGSGFLAKPNSISDLTRQLGYILTHKAAAQNAGRIGYDKIVQYTRQRVVRDYFLKGI